MAFYTEKSSLTVRVEFLSELSPGWSALRRPSGAQLPGVPPLSERLIDVKRCCPEPPSRTHRADDVLAIASKQLSDRFWDKRAYRYRGGSGTLDEASERDHIADLARQTRFGSTARKRVYIAMGSSPSCPVERGSV